MCVDNTCRINALDKTKKRVWAPAGMESKNLKAAGQFLTVFTPNFGKVLRSTKLSWYELSPVVIWTIVVLVKQITISVVADRSKAFSSYNDIVICNHEDSYEPVCTKVLPLALPFRCSDTIISGVAHSVPKLWRSLKKGLAFSNIYFNFNFVIFTGENGDVAPTFTESSAFKNQKPKQNLIQNSCEIVYSYSTKHFS